MSEHSHHTAPRAAEDWVALHVYYAANPQPLLTEGIRDVVRRLEDADLIDTWFYINYWLEGPHVRLRLRPRRPQDHERVESLAREVLEDFLARRPALYEVDSGFLGELYDQLFAMEFSDEEKARYTGPDGRMNLRPNNSVARLDYEPEYGKYGGVEGTRLAEWHFRHSSALTLEVLRSRNLHLRSMLLGTSAQLMMVMTACFLPDRQEAAQFLSRYHDFWQSHYDGTGFIADKEYEDGFLAGRATIAPQFDRILSAVGDDALERLPAELADWARHCLELRRRVVELARAGRLEFATWAGGATLPVSGVGQALVVLLSPYLHMTNNRLHVTIRDEAYLAHVLARCLTDESVGAA